MTPAHDLEAARALAEEHYFAPGAAEILIMAAASPVRSEERYRAQAALRSLAMDAEIPDPLAHVPSPLEAPARAIGVLLMECVYSGDAEERKRIATLLTILCEKAGRIKARRVA